MLTNMTRAALTVVGILVVALGPPSGASAQGGLYVGGGLGPAVGIDDWPTQVRLEEEIGYYFDGRPEGFFLGFSPSQSFSDDVFVLTFAPRAGFMFNLFRNDDLAFQLGPSGTIGLAVAGCYDDRCASDAYFHFSFSLMLRALIAGDRLAIYLRPLEFEFAFGDGVNPNPLELDPWADHAIRYVLEGGVQFPL
jgi:hypothetical protein